MAGIPPRLWRQPASAALGSRLGGRPPPTPELGHGGLREVAPFGDLPLVVGLDDHGGDQPVDGGVVGEDADDVGAPLDLAVEPLQGVRRPDLAPVRSGKAQKASRSSLARLRAWRPRRGTGPRSVSVMRSNCSRTVSASGWAKIVRMAAITIWVFVRFTRASTLRMKWTRQRCQADPIMTARWPP